MRLSVGEARDVLVAGLLGLAGDPLNLPEGDRRQPSVTYVVRTLDEPLTAPDVWPMSRVSYRRAADDHDHPPPRHRPGLPAAQEPRAAAVVRAVVRPGARLLPRGRPTSAARRRCCSTSTRSAWCAAAAGRRARGSRSSSTSTTGPYVASSFLSVAIAQVFGTALAGSSKERPELADDADPAGRPGCAVLPCRGGEAFLRRLFEPLGYESWRSRHPLDEPFPSGARAATSRSTLRHDGCALHDLLTHLYVLRPGARRRQALLGRRRRGGEAAPPRRGLAGRAPASASRSSTAT